MTIHTWIRKLLALTPRTARQTPARFRPCLEPLEDRTLLTITSTPSPTWTQQGPSNLSNQLISFPYPPPNAAFGQSTGTVESIAVDPSDPTQIIVGTVNGGVWRTTNSGARWDPLSDQLSSLSIGVVAYDPNDASGNTFYAGTGLFSSSFTNGGSAIGLYRTTNAGTTWTLLGNNAQGVNILAGKRIKDLAITGQIILVGTIHGNGNSLSENRNYAALGGELFRSTDGGVTFSQVLPASGLPSGAVTSIVVDPNNSQQIFATVAGRGVFHSTTGGATWTPFSTGLTNASISADVEVVEQNIGGVTTLFAGVSREFGGPNPSAPLAVFSTSNFTGGGNWTALAATPTSFNAGVNAPEKFNLATDPINAGVVYIDGWGGTGVFRYDPPNRSWVQIDQSGAQRTTPHADSRDLLFLNSTTLLEADDGGIYQMRNPMSASTSSWTSLNGNLAVLEITSVAYDSTNQVYFSGTQDNGSPHQNGANNLNATNLTGGDGNFQAVDTTSLSNGNVLGYSLSNNFSAFVRTQYDRNNNPVNPPEVTIVAATNTSPIQIEISSSLQLQAGHGIRIEGVTGNTAANGSWAITIEDATHFTLTGSAGNGVYLGGGKAARLLGIDTISGAAGQPIRITTSVANGFQTGDQVLIREPGAPYDAILNNNSYSITVNSPTQFTLNGTVATGAQATGGRVRLSSRVLLKSATGDMPNLILSGLNSEDKKFADEGSFNQHPMVLNSVNPRMMLLGFNGVYEDAGAMAITGASDASPIVITSPSNGLHTGERVVISGVLGNTAANGTWVITRLTANTFSLQFPDGTNSDGNGSYQRGGTWIRSTGFAGDYITNISTNVGTLTGKVSALAYGGQRNGIGSTHVAFVGTTSGQLFFRGETGAGFTNVPRADLGNPSIINSIALDPADWHQVYVVTDNQVWMTSNITNLRDNPFKIIGGGPRDNLTSLITPLGNLAPELRSIAIVGSNGQPGSGTVVVGALGGVYRQILQPPAGVPTTDTWSELGQGLPHVVVTSMVYSGDTLVAGTMGRGVWTLSNASANIRTSGIVTVSGTSFTLSQANNPLQFVVEDGISSQSFDKAAYSVVSFQGAPGDDLVRIDTSAILMTSLNSPDFVVKLNGGAGNNTLALAGPPSPGRLDWIVTGFNDGNAANGAVTFTAFQNLRGSTTIQAQDVFHMLPGGSLDGTIRGNGGVDFLDYSSRNTRVTVNLETGQATDVAGGVQGVFNVIGSASGGDTLTGNLQNGGILVGHGGGNTLTAGDQRSILIGGRGGDNTLTGGGSGDILIVGDTSYAPDQPAPGQQPNFAALTAILAYWQRQDLDYPVRTANLRAGNGLPMRYRLAVGVTVINSTLRSVVAGGGGTNWYFSGSATRITLGSGEVIN